MSASEDLMYDTMVGNKYHGLVTPRHVHKRQELLNVCNDMYNENIVDTVFIVAPLQLLKHDWMDAYDYKDYHIHGRNKLAVLKNDKFVKFINPEGLEWLSRHKQFIKSKSMLLVDMPEQFKSPFTNRSKHLHTLLDGFDRRYFITSQFFTNNAMDMYGQTYLLDKGETFNMDFYKFRRTYFSSYKPKFGPPGFIMYEPLPTARNDIVTKISDLVTVIKQDHNNGTWERGELEC